MSQENSAVAESPKSANLKSVLMKKIGMTRIFDSKGNHVPVTVLAIESAKIVQVKNLDNDGYTSVKFAYNQKREKLITAPKAGELKKASISESFSSFAETKISSEEVNELAAGMEIDLGQFVAGTTVHVSGKTKGKGFAGVVKKFGFAGGPKSHGSKFHRTTGSIGNRATPGKVWKGKKMPGHMGSENQTVKNLKIVELNAEKGYVLIKGSIPGAKNSFVRVTKA